MKRNASNTHFSTLPLTLIHLLDEIIVCPTTLLGFNFQSVDPQWFKPIREWILERVFKRECCKHYSYNETINHHVLT